MKRLSRIELELLTMLGTGLLSGRTLGKCYKKLLRRNISYGTLYTTMSRLCDHGLVVKKSKGGDMRLRYFAMTAAGIRTLYKEKFQLQTLISHIIFESKPRN